MDRDILDNILDSVQATIYTSLPGKIEKVYEQGKTTVVDVKPLINLYLPDGNPQEEQVLKGIPVHWPSGGGATLIFDISAGDIVTIHFYMRAANTFRQSDGSKPVTPVFKTLHDINHAYVVPGCATYLNGSTTTADTTSLGYDDVKINIKKDGNIEIGGNAYSVVNGESLMNYLTYLTSVVTPLPSMTVNPPSVWELDPALNTTQEPILSQTIKHGIQQTVTVPE